MPCDANSWWTPATREVGLANSTPQPDGQSQAALSMNTPMKKTTWLSRTSLSMRCLLLAAIASTATAALGPEQDAAGGPGNQDCDKTSAEMAAGPVTGTATKTFFDDDTDYNFAEIAADKDLKDKIAEASGIVCKICEGDRRCIRTTLLTSGTIVRRYTEIRPVPGTHDGGWKVDSTWTGKYKIRCEKC